MNKYKDIDILIFHNFQSFIDEQEMVHTQQGMNFLENEIMSNVKFLKHLRHKEVLSIRSEKRRIYRTNVVILSQPMKFHTKKRPKLDEMKDFPCFFSRLRFLFKCLGRPNFLVNKCFQCNRVKNKWVGRPH